MVSSDATSWSRYGHLEITQVVRLKSREIKQVVTSVHEWPSCGENCIQKFSCFSVRKGGMLYWPACWVAYKRKSWRAWTLVCSSDQHRYTPRGHNLNYTIWILYAESLTSHQCHSPLGMPWSTGARPFQSIRQLWARPSPRGAPFPIYKENLGAPSLQGRALLTGARPFFSIKQYAKNLEWI